MNEYSADLAQVCSCRWAVTGNSTDELMSKTKAHDKQTHQMTEVPAEIAHKLQAAIRSTM